jgi:DNA helicase MCM8
VVKALETEVAAGRGTAKAKSLFILYLDARSVAVTTHKDGLGSAPSNSNAAPGTTAAKQFSEKDLAFISRVRNHPCGSPFALVVASMCPAIFGQEMVKAGLLLGLFGGSPRNNSAKIGAPAISDASTSTGAAVVAEAEPVVVAPAGGVGGFERGTSKMHIRSDPHVLVVGDPGMGKSQMLQAVSALAPRGVYVCGNTTSTTGLTVVRASTSSNFSRV